MECILIEENDDVVVIEDDAPDPARGRQKSRRRQKDRCKNRAHKVTAPQITPPPALFHGQPPPPPTFLPPPLPCFVRPADIGDDDDWALIAYLARRRRDVVRAQLQRVLTTPTGPAVYSRRLAFSDMVGRACVVEVQAWEGEELAIWIAHQVGPHVYVAWVTPHCIADRWGVDAVSIKPFADSGTTQAAVVHRLLMGMLGGAEALVLQIIRDIVAGRNAARAIKGGGTAAA